MKMSLTLTLIMQKISDAEAEFGRADTVKEKDSTSYQVNSLSMSLECQKMIQTSMRRCKRFSKYQNHQLMEPIVKMISKDCLMILMSIQISSDYRRTKKQKLTELLRSRSQSSFG